LRLGENLEKDCPGLICNLNFCVLVATRDIKPGDLLQRASHNHDLCVKESQEAERLAATSTVTSKKKTKQKKQPSGGAEPLLVDKKISNYLLDIAKDGRFRVCLRNQFFARHAYRPMRNTHRWMRHPESERADNNQAWLSNVANRLWLTLPENRYGDLKKQAVEKFLGASQSLKQHGAGEEADQLAHMFTAVEERASDDFRVPDFVPSNACAMPSAELCAGQTVEIEGLKNFPKLYGKLARVISIGEDLAEQQRRFGSDFQAGALCEGPTRTGGKVPLQVADFEKSNFFADMPEKVLK
ncbi:unnamed protein product, partial [Amoebophrya sp. A25]